jgi:hypothetical protein
MHKFYIFAPEPPVPWGKTKNTMKRSKPFSFFLVIGFAILFSAPVQAQWITITRKIRSLRTSQADVATVMIEGSTFKVYRAVIDTLTSNPKFQVTGRKDAERLVEFTRGTSKISMKVDSIANGLSQITVSAAHADNVQQQATDIAVSAVFSICKKVGVTCTLDK